MTHRYRGTIKLGKTVRKALFQIEVVPSEIWGFLSYVLHAILGLGSIPDKQVTVRIFKPRRKWYSFNYYKSVNKNVQASSTKYLLQFLIKNIN